MHARSHKYPDTTTSYTDTTYYDTTEKYLDIGYQRLKLFQPKLYPELAILKKLFIDHNDLETLPNPELVPNLEELMANVNKLKTIPFYPKLTFCNIAHNQITNCQSYHNSNLVHFDCSYNPNFKLNFRLGSCKNLFTNDSDIESIDLSLFPQVEILDCSNNKLQSIGPSDSLVEISLDHNMLRTLPIWPNIHRISANHNLLENIPSYPKLSSLGISHNLLKRVPTEPSLRKLVANNNQIAELGDLPQIILLGLEHNNISSVTLCPNIKYASLQFNPVSDLVLGPDVLKSIKELQVNFNTFEKIYHRYYKFYNAINVETNGEKLESQLKKLGTAFDEKIISYIFRKFHMARFNDRSNVLLKVSLKLYLNCFSTKNIGSIEELMQKKEFQYLLENMTNLYYKTIVITLYFGKTE